MTGVFRPLKRPCPLWNLLKTPKASIYITAFPKNSPLFLSPQNVNPPVTGLWTTNRERYTGHRELFPAGLQGSAEITKHGNQIR